MNTFTEQEAKARAKAMGKGYIAKRIRGLWYVWSIEADHYVEFDR